MAFSVNNVASRHHSTIVPLLGHHRVSRGLSKNPFCVDLKMVSRSILPLRIAAPAFIHTCSAAKDMGNGGEDDFAMLEQYMEGINKRLINTILGNHWRFLPTLCIASCQVVGGKESQAMPVACISVMMALATFTRDDPPRTDDMDHQNGKQENHEPFDMTTDPPADDPLICRSFDYLANHAGSMSFQQFKQVYDELSSLCKSGWFKGGVMMDKVREERTGLGFEELEYAQVHKSGKIFGATAAMGAIVGGANEEEVKTLRRFGIKTGLLYEAVDDIKNETKTGSDPASGKWTFVKAKGTTDGARTYADKLLEEAFQPSWFEPEKAALLRNLVIYIHGQQYL